MGVSLFKWSTPERRSVDRILPIIPNEIYLHTFEHIIPLAGCQTPEQLTILTNLSCVCRFFANVCLPCIFKFVEFSGSILPGDTPSRFRNARATTLCKQIAAKQPLALSLAECVKTCHFTKWKLDGIGSWATRLFVEKYIAGMLHTRNIRELRFKSSFVDTEHWRAITTLESLEALSFHCCQFLQGPVDVEPAKRVELNILYLEIIHCTGLRQPISAIDPRHLRTLAMDLEFLDQVNWLPQSALTEILVYASSFLAKDLYLDKIHAILMQAPRSVEALWFFIKTESGIYRDVVRHMFNGPAWKNLPLLRSLTLSVWTLETSAKMIFYTLDGIALLTDLQSFTLEDRMFMCTPHTDVRRLLQDRFGPTSNLRSVDICGQTFRLVDGEWSPVSRRTAPRSAISELFRS